MFEDIFEYLKDVVLNNEFGQAGVVMSVLTAIWLTVKSWPHFAISRIKRHIFYKLTVEQSDELYVLLSRWIKERYPDKLRNVQAHIQEVYGDYQTFDKEEGGVKFTQYEDYFHTWYKGRFITIAKQREKMEGARNMENAYLGRIIISGVASRAIINNVAKEALALKELLKENEFNEYVPGEYQLWAKKVGVCMKSVDRLYFPGKKIILDKVDEFSSSAAYYEKRGIEWRLGILLHGQPGSGKSSMARALAEYTKRDLYSLNLSNMSNERFKSLFSSIEENALLVLDDIDICIPKREPEKDSSTKLTLSTLLSALSGMDSRSDIIIVMTTNHKDSLDKALIRKGRIDVLQEVSFPNKKNLQDYICNFYEKEVIFDFETPHISMVEVQDICLSNKNAADAIKQIQAAS